MNEKAKITLTPEQETLLIMLHAKAQPGNPLFFDPKAQDILSRVAYDFSRLRVPSGEIFQDGQTGASHRVLPTVIRRTMMTETLIPIVSDPAEQATADLVDSACIATLQLIHASWGLGAPPDCRIYVMTSWLGFIFQSALRGHCATASEWLSE